MKVKKDKPQSKAENKSTNAVNPASPITPIYEVAPKKNFFQRWKQKHRDKKYEKEFGASEEVVKYFLTSQNIAEYNASQTIQEAQWTLLPAFEKFKDYYTYYDLLMVWNPPAWTKIEFLMQSIFINEKIYNFHQKNYIPLIYDDYNAIITNEQRKLIAQSFNLDFKAENLDQKIITLNDALFNLNED